MTPNYRKLVNVASFNVYKGYIFTETAKNSQFTTKNYQTSYSNHQTTTVENVSVRSGNIILMFLWLLHSIHIFTAN